MKLSASQDYTASNGRMIGEYGIGTKWSWPDHLAGWIGKPMRDVRSVRITGARPGLQPSASRIQV
jgi:hypothetical protein